MRRLAFLLVFACACSGGDFQVPPQPDLRVPLDLAANMSFPMVDAGCVTTACGGCSQRASWNGGGINAGDPCNWNGTWTCNGTMLQCSSTACLSCPQTVNGTVCGADGHTIIELVYQNSACVAYDWGSAIDVCNHGASDQCLGTCAKNAGGSYDCVAHCASDDGGGTGHPYAAGDTCATLAM